MTQLKRAPLARPPPVLVAIVGGSGSGKTWLADKLKAELAPDAARLSQDEFYLDRSHLSPARRARINFDHPRAIDWAALEHVLRDLLAGRRAKVPIYDFTAHCRRRGSKPVSPKPIILVDGLWLLRQPSIRCLLTFSIFLDCPSQVRLRRRLARDRLCRGRGNASVKKQFRTTVEPMHAKFVVPQARWTNLVLPWNYRSQQLKRMAAYLRNLGAPTSSGTGCSRGH